MRVVDAFCGTGGWSAGAVAAGCTPVLGIDCDEKPLRLWRTNCPSGRAACARVGTDDAVEWPEVAPDVHVHLSPPCTSLSKARAGSAPAGTVAAALETVIWCVRLALDKGFASWSMENVATPAVVACVADLVCQHPTHVAYVVVDAADFGVASNRVRLIASTPAVVRALKEEPIKRVSVADAFAVAGLELPAQFLKSNTSNRNGTPCVRSVQGPAFTVTASHPLIWCERDGVTIRCLTVAESAVLMGFPSDWKLPQGSRVGLRAVGNAVPPPLAKAVMACAVHAAHAALTVLETAPVTPEAALATPGAADAQEAHEPAEPAHEPAEPAHEPTPHTPSSQEPTPTPEGPAHEPTDTQAAHEPSKPAEPAHEPAEPAHELASLKHKVCKIVRRLEALEAAQGDKAHKRRKRHKRHKRA